MLNHTRRLLAVLIICATFSAVGCTKKTGTPQPPPLTPEQKFAIAKIGAQTAAAGLAVAIDSVQRQFDKTTDASTRIKLQARIKYLSLGRAILDEFNAQVANVTVIDLSTREGVKLAINKALTGFDNLLAGDFINLDPDLQSLLRGAIAVAKGAVQSFDVLFPATP